MAKLDQQTVFKQEQDRLRKLFPAPADIPSCLGLFDSYLSCSAIRSQVKSIYRFGQRPECSPKFEEFKFCMSLKALHPEERREAWIRRQAEWWTHRRLDKSSEEVWDVRTEPLQSYPKPITEEMLAGES